MTVTNSFQAFFPIGGPVSEIQETANTVFPAPVDGGCIHIFPINSMGMLSGFPAKMVSARQEVGCHKFQSSDLGLCLHDLGRIKKYDLMATILPQPSHQQETE